MYSLEGQRLEIKYFPALHPNLRQGEHATHPQYTQSKFVSGMSIFHKNTFIFLMYLTQSSPFVKFTNTRDGDFFAEDRKLSKEVSMESVFFQINDTRQNNILTDHPRTVL